MAHDDPTSPGQAPDAGRRQQSTGTLQLGGHTWPHVDAAQSGTSGNTRVLLLVPVGACEQHGPHLPVNTDAVIAESVAKGVAEALRDTARVLVAPTVAYGASGEHGDFPGTVSVGSEALYAMLAELGRSSRHWAGRIVFVNGHGGNATALVATVRTLRAEGSESAWIPCAVDAANSADPVKPPRPPHQLGSGDLHAGHTETSLMLALRPESVHMELAEPGNTATASELMPVLRDKGVCAVSASGVLGDPTGASAAAGREILDRIVVSNTRRIAAWQPEPTGVLAPTARANTDM